ncbi:MAG: VOC family protein [Hyphomonadaceae bacterium]|nr:VOC family protein [Hyphomonadaceae bacterium]
MTDPLDGSHTAPKFAAPDPGALAEWYVDALGFPRKAVFEGGDYAIVARGSLTLHLWKCGERKIAENTACYTEISSIEALDTLHAEWLTASTHPGFHPGRIEPEPKNQPGHGMREFHVWDPAGNLIGFGAAIGETN